MNPAFARNTMVVATLAVAAALPANAAPMNVATGNDYAPYADSKLPEGGLTTEVVKRVFAEMKQELTLDWLPWARGFDSAKAGTHAGTFPYARQPDREKDFLFSDPLYEISEKMFVKAGSTLTPSTLAGTKDKKMCLPLGWGPTPSVKPMMDSGALKVEAPKDITTCAKMVAAGRADFYVSDVIQGAAALKSAGVASAEVVAANGAFGTTTLHLIAGKTAPGAKELIEKFNVGLAALRKSGAYDKIVAKHSQ